MKRYLYLLIFLSICVGVDAGLFDRIKKAATDTVQDEIDKEINKQTEKNPEQTPEQTQKNTSTDKNAPQAANNSDSQPINSVEDLYGRWEGGVVPAKPGLMDRVSLNIVIMPDFASMRCSAAGSHCFSELTPTDTLGTYDAKILDQQTTWGTKASVAFTDGGQVSVDWIDLPNTPADKRVYSGQLKKTLHPYPRKQWSSSPEQRKNFDIVGFTLGMTYEEAKAYSEAKHDNLEPATNVVRDDGTTSIIWALKEKGAKKYGADLLGEQITLGFESQTPDELNVEQDPETMAKIKEREQIMEERSKLQLAQRQQRRSRSQRDANTAAAQPDLPEIPPMPQLRPEGADAEAVFISRRVEFNRNEGPHKDNVIKALIEKYGQPSIHIEPQPGWRIKLAWIFDTAGNRIANAAGGPFDQITKDPSLSEKENYYSPALTAFQAGTVFNLVTISPDCGLVVKAQLDRANVSSNSVYCINTTVYDTQRLLGDEWFRTTHFEQALVANEKAKSKALENRDVPDF